MTFGYHMNICTYMNICTQYMNMYIHMNTHMHRDYDSSSATSFLDSTAQADFVLVSLGVCFWATLSWNQVLRVAEATWSVPV